MSDAGNRQIGLFGATSVGVGAIVGGGILALAGSAFASTGPSALIAFALNGLIAVFTALSFAEMSSKFPESGGTYTFAKKVLSIESAFTVGWVVWFASIVAGVLYALGFGQFAAVVIDELWKTTGRPPPFDLVGRPMICGLALTATLLYAVGLLLRTGSGGPWVNVGKVVVFCVLIGGGLWAMFRLPPGQVTAQLRPFFTSGGKGLITAMGFTFIALQGFDLIAAVAGEIRDPVRVVPRAMLGSLAIALAIYLPLLLVIATAGVPTGTNVATAAAENPETIVALAAENYLGRFGFWLVLVAAVLSMLSALQANLLAASRVAMAMARDRTLPRSLSILHPTRNTPQKAVLVTSGLIAAIVIVLPDVAAAGAASSLIFLITFALAHWITILVRQRSRLRPPPFQSPFFPLVPVAGGTACLGLAIFQGVMVPSAGAITLFWLFVGGGLFLVLFARRARLADASGAALDPELVRLRGRTPLILVPIANPAHARGLVAVASALTPPEVGRVLMLSVVVAPDGWLPDEDRKPLENTQEVLAEALSASVGEGVFPEAMTTVATAPWPEIARVAAMHRCESLLVGLSNLPDDAQSTPLDELIAAVDSDVVVLRSPHSWHPDRVKRILVATRGRGGHEHLLARLLGSLERTAPREVTFLSVLPDYATDRDCSQTRAGLRVIAGDVVPGTAEVEVLRSEAPIEALAERANHSDLLVLGVRREGSGKQFGSFLLEVARKSTCPMLIISRRR